MLRQDFWLVRERMVDMREEVERNRLGARLAEARRAKGILSKEVSPRRGVVAQGAAVVLALFK